MIGLVTFFSRKESNQRNAPRAGAARRCPVLLGESGDGAELAALKQRRLFAPDSPAVLGSLQGGLKSRAAAAHAGFGSAGPYPASEVAVFALIPPSKPAPSARAGHGFGFTATAHAGNRREPAGGAGQDRPRHGCRGRAYRDVLAACPARPHPQAPSYTRKAPFYPANHTQQKTRPRPGFSHDQTTIRNQSPCCFCRCSQRSWASMVRSAVRRASRRSRPISSPVSTQ